MISMKNGVVPSGGLSTASMIIREQGIGALWRGNMPKVYQNSMQIFTRVLFFDKAKNWMMPYDTSKYSGFDYFWRITCSSTICMGLTLAFTYPFELIHTRTSSDMSRKGQ
jgi:hypothetical protein